jgi:UDP-N-acetylmuramoyl-tripeptide--D-alanyl-D-alanine ligase
VIKLELTEVVKAMAGRAWWRVPTISVGGVSTDSRTVQADELFFAIPGPRFDGHDFVVQALERGAIGAVVEAGHADKVKAALQAADDNVTAGAAIIEVDAVVGALGRLAAYHREQFSGEVIAVVGSNGKTTTKAMIHHILSGRLRGHCSPKSFNNEIGVPLTLLSAELKDDYLVVEIGTNAPGEVAALGQIVRPDLVVLTCIGEEHLEKLGSIAGVVAEETAIFDAVPDKGFVAVNIDHPAIQPHLPESGGRLHVAAFGRSADADVRLSEPRYEAPWLHFRLNERFDFKLRLPGVHNATNAAGAVTVVRRLGLDFGEAAQRLESFVAPPMRNEVLDVGGVTIVNDAYNANPASAAAAIDVLEQLPCRGARIVVFGEMKELGDHSDALHRQVAERLRAANVQRVLLVGDGTGPMYDALGGDALFGPTVERCADVAAAQQRLCDTVQAGDVILLKASRAVALERLVDPLRQRLDSEPVG